MALRRPARGGENPSSDEDDDGSEESEEDDPSEVSIGLPLFLDLKPSRGSPGTTGLPSSCLLTAFHRTDRLFFRTLAF